MFKKLKRGRGSAPKIKKSTIQNVDCFEIRGFGEVQIFMFLPSSVPVQSKFSPVGTEYNLNPDYFYPPPPPPTWDSSNEALPDYLGG